jgi:hypothetical protein
MMRMKDLSTRILGLSDEEVIESANYAIKLMEKEAIKKHIITSEFKDYIIGTDGAIEVLSEAFPDVSEQLKEAVFTKQSKEAALISKRLLLYMAQQESHKSQVQEALDIPRLLVCDPLTVMAISGIVFLLSLDFEAEYDESDGKRRIHWKITKKSTPLNVIEQILGLVRGG